MLFFSALFLPEDVWEVSMFMHFPVIVQLSQCTDCAATRLWMLLTHVYCHHQEVALLNSSTELNFSLQAKISSWEQKKKTTLFQHPRTVLLSNSSVRIILLWLNKTMTKQDAGGRVFFPPNINVTATVILNLYLNRVASWDWHILFKTPVRKITTLQPRAAFVAGNWSHLSPVNALMPL